MSLLRGSRHPETIAESSGEDSDSTTADALGSDSSEEEDDPLRNLVHEIVQQASQNKTAAVRLHEALAGCVWLCMFEKANIPLLLEESGVTILIDTCQEPRPKIQNVQVRPVSNVVLVRAT